MTSAIFISGDSNSFFMSDYIIKCRCKYTF